MLRERRAYRRLRKIDETAYATRYAAAMLEARKYAECARRADPRVARIMGRIYAELCGTETGMRIRAFGKPKRTRMQKTTSQKTKRTPR